MIGYAFRFSPERVTGPDWMMNIGTPGFDIAATIPQGTPQNQAPEMLQALLTDRFKLALHRGSAIQPICALAAPDDSRGFPDIFVALQKELGLKLVRTADVPMDVIVIDAVNKIPTEN